MPKSLTTFAWVQTSHSYPKDIYPEINKIAFEICKSLGTIASAFTSGETIVFA